MLQRLVGIIGLVSAVVGFSGVQAQSQKPKQNYYIGEGGVDLQTGSFYHSNTDIAIGDPQAGGLVLTRTSSTRPNSFSMGGNNGHSQEVTLYRDAYRPNGAGPGIQAFHHYVVIGEKVYQFEQWEFTTVIDNPPGADRTLTKSGTNGPFVFTDRDGTVINFPVLGTCEKAVYQTWNCSPATDITRPDGTKTTFTYDLSGAYKRLRLVSTSRGFGLGFEYNANKQISRVCAINTANSYVTSTLPCPSGAPSALYTYGTGPGVGESWSTFTDPAGVRTDYTYGIYGISSIKKFGNSVNDVSLTYGLFPASRDARVTSQTFANGSTWTYQYYSDAHPYADEFGNFEESYNPWTRVIDPNNGQEYNTFLAGTAPKPSDVTDELNRTSSFTWIEVLKDWLPTKKISPEGNETRYAYDSRGNQTESRMVAKAGTGLPDIVSTATYAASCTNRVTCNRPLTTTDAKGNVTTYTYDATHGGVLTETGPAVNGIQPQKRHEYAQRYAWVKNSSGGYVQASPPVWVKTRERYCRTTAASGSSCSGGAIDEVVTDYDYGPNSGPNNLLLRGIVVTAANGSGVLESLRTCYGYDALGRRISETRPAANLAACP